MYKCIAAFIFKSSFEIGAVLDPDATVLGQDLQEEK